MTVDGGWPELRFRVTPEIHDKLFAIAEKEERSVAAQMRVILRGYVAQVEKSELIDAVAGRAEAPPWYPRGTKT